LPLLTSDLRKAIRAVIELHVFGQNVEQRITVCVRTGAEDFGPTDLGRLQPFPRLPTNDRVGGERTFQVGTSVCGGVANCPA
jgi:hypothetical protein